MNLNRTLLVFPPNHPDRTLRTRVRVTLTIFKCSDDEGDVKTFTCVCLQLDEMCITFDGGKTRLNFAEAALLIQGSTCIYSKKVKCGCVVMGR